MTTLFSILVSLTMVGAFGIWYFALPAFFRHEFPLSYLNRNRSPSRFLVLLAVVFGQIIAAQIASLVIPLNSHLTDEQFDPNLIFQSTLAGVLFVGIGFLILTISLTIDGNSSYTFADFGMTAEHSERQLKDGIAGFLICLLPTIALLALTSVFRNPENQHVYLKYLANEPAIEVVCCIVLTACVLAPLVEELMFRVVLQGWLQQRIRPGLAIWITAILFCIAHPITDSLPLLPLALTLGYLYYYRYSYWTVVTTHALFNSFMVAGVLMSSSEVG